MPPFHQSGPLSWASKPPCVPVIALNIEGRDRPNPINLHYIIAAAVCKPCFIPVSGLKSRFFHLFLIF